MTRRAGPTGTPKEASGKAQTHVRAADSDVAGDGHLGAGAHAGTVAGADGGLGKRDEGVVDVGEELHALDTSVGVELLAYVGAGGEAKMIRRGEDERARFAVFARGGDVPEHLLEHLRVHRVSRRRAVEAKDGNAVRDVVGVSRGSVIGVGR